MSSQHGGWLPPCEQSQSPRQRQQCALWPHPGHHPQSLSDYFIDHPSHPYSAWEGTLLGNKNHKLRILWVLDAGQYIIKPFFPPVEDFFSVIIGALSD